MPQLPSERLKQWRASNAFVERMLAATFDDDAPCVAPHVAPNAVDNHPLRSERLQLHLDDVTHSRLTAGNTCKLLLNGNSGQKKFDLVDTAKHSLFITALIYHCDAGGQALTDKLVAARKRGVDVRLVVDALGAVAGVGCFHKLREAGVKLTVSSRSLAPTTIDWEMHDKLFIQDGKRAVVGGQNVGSWYFDSNGVDDNYRDTDLYVEGPVVRDVGRRFMRIWQEQNPLDASLERFCRQQQELDVKDATAGRLGRQHYKRWLAPIDDGGAAGGGAAGGGEGGKGVCRFVGQDPHKGTFHVFETYQLLAQRCRQHLALHALSLDPVGSPHQERLRDTLVALAAKKKGRVDILTNGPGLLKSRAMPAQLGSLFGSSFLSDAHEGFVGSDVNLYAYRSYLHSKVFAFDHVAAAIGSFNYDASGVRCQESTVVCWDPTLVRHVDAMFANDLANSTPVPLVVDDASDTSNTK